MWCFEIHRSFGEQKPAHLMTCEKIARNTIHATNTFRGCFIPYRFGSFLTFWNNVEKSIKSIYSNIFAFSKKSCQYRDFKAETGLKWKVWKFYILSGYSRFFKIPLFFCKKNNILEFYAVVAIAQKIQ